MPKSTLSCSYILLTYNQEDLVREAVESALAQSGTPIEIVISDDFSADNTFAVIEETIAGYGGPHKIKINRNPKNLGLAGNIARAHELSTGDVLVAAAGDDYSFPQRCERIMEVFAAENPLLVCSYANVVGMDGQQIPGDYKTAKFYHSTDIETAAQSMSLYIGATGAWHRTLYDKYGPIDPDAYEDLVLGFRAALEGKVSVIKDELVNYRLGVGVTSSQTKINDIETFKKQRLKGFVVSDAVTRQRLKDARTFGLPNTSPVWATLKQAQTKSLLGVAYYQYNRWEFLKASLMHPLLSFNRVYSERRRAHKMRKSPSSKNTDPTT